jgi:hypothetical protein
MKIMVLFIAAIVLSPPAAEADDKCFEKYGLCMGYCGKLSSACALRCDDERMQCERPKQKVPGPYSQKSLT